MIPRQDLDRHVALQLRVPREPDLPHPALSDRFNDPVVPQRLPGDVRHGHILAHRPVRGPSMRGSELGVAVLRNSISASEATIPEEMTIVANPGALEPFKTLERLHLFALAFRANNMKTPAGRARRIAALVDRLSRGETI